MDVVPLRVQPHVQPIDDVMYTLAIISALLFWATLFGR
jgi:hypothetical protein